MRAGLSTIQQTLTPEAASVLNHAIAEAGRRNHGQTTPLHVAATLLASPSGFLRQACIKSHPNSSHPLQCRALELCFSVALERLPTAQNVSPAMEPPISNALMAALKRAQAHQRRGCPEQQQQPLLAVKVELEQLIISILDDPSVSRVMREASFSSPAVKATIEQSLNSAAASAVNSNSVGLGFRPTAVAPAAVPSRNLYLNPRLQQGSVTAAQLGQQRGEEVKRVVDIMMRRKKRNPILVGESEPEGLMKELLKRIENKELGEGCFTNVHLLYLEKELPSNRGQIAATIKKLGDLIETRMENSSYGGFLINLGDLKWLVEQAVGFGVTGLGNVQQQTIAESARAAVAEMGRLIAKFGEGGAGRLWLLGTATCETYLRCQVYHPSMETDWDLQAVPITSRAPLLGMFPRIGTNGLLGSTLESLSPIKGFPTTTITPPRRASENIDPAQRSNCCPQCMQRYEQEVGDILKEIEKSDTELKSEAARLPLPQWLQNARTSDDDAKVIDQTQSNSQEVIVKKTTQELRKKWHAACLNLHPEFHQQNLSSERIAQTPFSMTGLYNTNSLSCQFQPKVPLNKNLVSSLQLSSNPKPLQPSERTFSPLESPVRTELVLGQTKPADVIPEQTHKERIKDFMSCMSSESQVKCDELQSKKLLDADSFKKLLKGLTEKVWWQQDAASAVATTVTQCKVGNGKRRRVGGKGDMWLLFLGPDRIGKKKMVAALSELVSGSNPIIISLAPRRGDGDSDVHLRGKTALDHIAEAIRRNPFSMIMLEGIDEADMLIRGSIKRAMEQGRFPDSYGREISLGNVMFILTANWLPEDLRYLCNGTSVDEEKLANLARGGWQLRLSLAKRTAKRRPNWLSNEDRSMKPRKEMSSALAFDLNEAADAEDDKADGSLNSSDLTMDHEDNRVLNNGGSPTIPPELLEAVDDAIVFKPVNFGPIRRNFAASITKRFSTIMGSGISIEVQEEALEKITSGVWLGQTSIEEWTEKVLVPSFHQLKKSMNPSTNDHESSSPLVRLEVNGNSDSRSSEDWLPATVRVVAEEC